MKTTLFWRRYLHRNLLYLPYQLVTNLLNSLVDPLLKIPALRGLGNIAQCSKAMIDKYSPTGIPTTELLLFTVPVLDALMSAIDDKLDDVVLEAMNGLAKVFKVVDEVIDSFLPLLTSF